MDKALVALFMRRVVVTGGSGIFNGARARPWGKISGSIGRTDIEGLAQLRPQGNVGPPRTRRGIQYVEHTEGDGVEMFKAVCKLGLEGIVSKKLNAPYKSGPSKAWLKVKNPNAPAATRAIDGTF
jgi:hypothetical protein